ncbi:MAG: hypothetical protein ACREC0_00390 [Methylocella sp.]
MPQQQQHYGLGIAVAEFAETVGQNISRYNALPPFRKNLFRAGGGAGLITFCIYVAVEFKTVMGLTFDQLLRGLMAVRLRPRRKYGLPSRYGRRCWPSDFCGSSSACGTRAGHAM